ncbi:replication endonuclease, partial [Vibrio vulnificus]|uniref:replication endonuclease n=1 Tax=Vibrio vulnificus TaxID=672 RepID=UPI000AA3C5D6
MLERRRRFRNDERALSVLREFVAQKGLTPYDGQYSLKGEVARYSDRKWWLRGLRKALRRNTELVFHHLNQENKHKSLYCSMPTLMARRQQKTYQKADLENTTATNELGQSISLLELSHKSVSDPTIRKVERMGSARGFAELAN